MHLFLQHLSKQKEFKSVVMLYGFIFLTSFAVTACSGSSTKTGKAGVTVVKPAKNQQPHIHPENACLGARSHSHIGGDKQHEHSYQCESTAKNTNAHIHPAKGKYPEMRHVHPNGSNQHSHY